MGCVQTRRGGAEAVDPSATITLGNYGGGGRPNIGKSQGYQTMAPDPDLGWKRLPNSVPIPIGGTAAGSICDDPTEWTSSVAPSSSNRGRRASSSEYEDSSSADYGQVAPQHQRSLYPAPHAWTVCFFNDRSGHFCNVSIIALAINIAIRAVGLAKMFGIVNDAELFSNIHQRNIPVAQPMEGLDAEESKGQPDLHHRIYIALRVPDTGWRLLRRSGNESRSLSNRRAGATESKRNELQMIRREPAGEAVWADVAEIGMNIAEQLYRLERRKDNRHFLPTDSFGWRFSEEMEIEDQFRVAVSSPENESFWLVPEELIMNVTQWVQQTYLTSTAF